MNNTEKDRLAAELMWPGEKLCFEDSHNGRTEISMGKCCGCGGRYLHYWHPTTSIKQAMMVAEKMWEKEWLLSLCQTQLGDWFAIFQLTAGLNGCPGEAYGVNAADAIVTAALQAVQGVNTPPAPPKGE